ncbi:unnamed protein product [Parnassius apollo]|uniref:(apollo) hypothetical protein n=1 Tax=Parnassius apollo TaxID=110799 RepID=A0A8S3WQ09_PARAO|nr:unnamed protein product [Parnassius apollo]
MSDSIKELCKKYEENVAEPHARSIGLFPIPEYPEFEAERGMWSTALDAILTTLRYLAPATLLTLLWSQQSFIFKLLKYINTAFRSLIFSNEEQKQTVLQWLSDYGPVRVDDLSTVWRNGWILCGVLDTALPGACAGHPPSSLSVRHAQSIADHYLGVEPVFSREELESNDTLSKNQEWRLTTYLDHLRQALSKITPPVTKPSLEKTYPENTQFTLDYIARGSGLTAAQINRPMYFKIYPTSQQSIDPGEITITIKGPEDTYGMKVVPPLLGKAQLIRQQLLDVRSQTSYTENALPLAHGATYFRSYGKNDMTKTYYVPKTKYNIDIDVELTTDHVKIGYIANLKGKYTISITSKGQNIIGSPFTITSSNNILGLLEKESFCLEDGEEIDIVDVKTDRKVVLRIVDFVTEKMLLKENGTLEKISEEEAKYLMENDVKIENIPNLNTRNLSNIPSIEFNESYKKFNKFNEIANKVLKMNNICKVFRDLSNDKEMVLKKGDVNFQTMNQQDIPDIVNSTLNEINVSSLMLTNKQDKIIIPEKISVSILTERTEFNETDNSGNNNNVSDKKDEITQFKILRDTSLEKDDTSMHAVLSPSNPFLTESHNLSNKKSLGECTTSKSESKEQTCDTLMKNAVEESEPLIDSNPFIDFDILEADQPKPPVFKIISEFSTYQDDSINVDSIPHNNMTKRIDNDLLNPFQSSKNQFSSDIEQNQFSSLPVTDFVIGAPVSLPPNIKSVSHETDTETIGKVYNENTIIPLGVLNPTTQPKIQSYDVIKNNRNTESDQTECSSINSNITDEMNDGNASPKKELRDSAYVSIDENHTSPDNNNNENNTSKETQSKQKCLNTQHIPLNIGPAERELWENCTELKEDNCNKIHDETTKLNKWDLKKLQFMPIFEEIDKKVSSDMKEAKSEKADTDSVTSAFAEINEMYDDYFPSSEKISSTNETKNHNSLEDLYETENKNEYVKSASEKESDVMRHGKQIGGKISEIQAHVTESVSVSQTLHVDKNEDSDEFSNRDEVKFRDKTYTNIVLEKKKYWDEKIRLIEAKDEESRAQQKKRRLSAKQLRHNDSLSKRRGKQIVKKYLNANESIQNQNKVNDIQQVEVIKYNSKISQIDEDYKGDKKRVKNWKAFWDNKLERENNETQISCFRTNSPKTRSSSTIKNDNVDETDIDSKTQANNSKTTLPVKQEIPEEVFKAFETSPKRFFGTSRKQILNKIDTFLGKPNAVEEPLIDNTKETYESGLVSSRISLFHNISQKEEIPLPWTQRKSQSSLNINPQNDNLSENYNNTILNNSTRYGKEKSESVNHSPSLHEQTINNENPLPEAVKSVSLNEKRSRITNQLYTKSTDETSYHRFENDFPHQDSYVQKTVKFINTQQPDQAINNSNNVYNLSNSKSEMDIFNKFANRSHDEDFDKYKSYDELPKINVKSFISLYEDVSKSSETKPMRKSNNTSLEGSVNPFKPTSSIFGTPDKKKPFENNVSLKKQNSTTVDETNTHQSELTGKVNLQGSSFNSAENLKTKDDSFESENISTNDFEKENTYISLSDIELEIVDNLSERSVEMSPERDVDIAPADYKSRFKMAKEYFQSLEELRVTKKPNKLNECELLLYNKSTESLTENKQIKQPKKKSKSHTMPSSQISEYFNQLQEQQNENKDHKPIKISEKFHVEDLFTDVMEGRFSRQGSLRGIPHKKAVLEAFRSMENISNHTLSPYEFAVTQLNDFTVENKMKNAQTYLSEYPYLPTTNPSEYHSRLDAKASGLISFKELLSKKVRRNSVPDLRLNPSFAVDL